MNNDEKFNVLRLEELNNMTKIQHLQDKQLESMVTALVSKENKYQIACSLVRDTLKLVEGDSIIYAQYINHMLQMNSIFLKKYNAKKGDVEETAVGDTGVTKIKIDKRMSNF